MRAVAVIPARMGSKRVPGKVMVDVHGEPLVVHVWRRVKAAETIEDVWVATDSEEVAEAIRAAGGQVLWTEGSFSCGTERVAAASVEIPADIILNVQSDCAYLEPSVLDSVVAAFKNPEVNVATPVSPFPGDRNPSDPSIVKAVLGDNSRIVYFSRCPVPHGGPWVQHIGVYGFRREALLQFLEWGQSTLESSEQLEQLRILEHGHCIHAVHVEDAGLAIDCPEDVFRLSTISTDSSPTNPRL